MESQPIELAGELTIKQNQFSLKTAFVAVTLLALALASWRFVPHVVLFIVSFAFVVQSCRMTHRQETTKSRLIWSGLTLVATAVFYLTSFGPVLLTSRVIEHGLVRTSFFATVSQFLESVFYAPVLAGGQPPALLWYAEAWLLRRGTDFVEPHAAYVLFCVLSPWMIVAAVIAFLLWKSGRKRMATSCGVCCFFILLAVGVTTIGTL